jgi:hypothetical protein
MPPVALPRTSADLFTAEELPDVLAAMAQVEHAAPMALSSETLPARLVAFYRTQDVPLTLAQAEAACARVAAQHLATVSSPKRDAQRPPSAPTYDRDALYALWQGVGLTMVARAHVMARHWGPARPGPIPVEAFLMPLDIHAEDAVFKKAHALASWTNEDMPEGHLRLSLQHSATTLDRRWAMAHALGGQAYVLDKKDSAPPKALMQLFADALLVPDTALQHALRWRLALGWRQVSSGRVHRLARWLQAPESSVRRRLKALGVAVR